MRYLTSMAVLTVLLAGALCPRPSAAQVRFAPQMGWGSDHDLAIGGRLVVKLSRLTSSDPDRGLTSKADLVLPFDWFIDCADCTYFEVTPGLVLPLTVKDAGAYLGAGVNLARLSVDESEGDRSDMKVGLGLMGGLLVPVKSLMTFGELRVTAGGAKQLVVSAGVFLGGRRR